MNTLTPNADGYYHVVLSCLKVHEVDGAVKYYSNKDMLFVYDAKAYDAAVLDFQERNRDIDVICEADFPASSDPKRIIETRLNNAAFIIKANSLTMHRPTQLGARSVVIVKALVKPLVIASTAWVSAADFGLRAIAQTKFLHSRDPIAGHNPLEPIEVRYISHIVTWDFVGLNYSKRHESNDSFETLVQTVTALAEGGSVDIPSDIKTSDEFYEWVHKDSSDHLEPIWPTGADALIKKGRARNWKEFVGEETRELWSSFNDSQRSALCKTFTSIAEWANAGGVFVMTTKIAYNSSTVSLPEDLAETLRAHPTLGPLKGSSDWWGYGDIPRHHPELIRVVEEWKSKSNPHQAVTIETIKGSRYPITESDMEETLWSDDDFIDASVPLDPEIIRMSPDDFSNPEWDEVDRVSNWRNYVPDSVKGIWSTFTEHQKAILATGFDIQACGEEWN